MNSKEYRQPSILATLRAIVPKRPLTGAEARKVCELQATKLRKLLRVGTAEFPEDLIPSLPRIEVREVLDLPTSGSSQWSDGKWIIAINGLEPWQRQRFSVGHELWHVINYRTMEWLCPDERSRTLYSARLADYFSGCLYLPRQAVRQAMHQGCGLEDLADLFGVSTAAVTVRLSQLGMNRRCVGAWKPAREVAA